MTTNQGHPINDDDNSLTVGERGPTLLQDFQFIEKIAHFDRERIPERVVHAKGAGAFGYFQVYKSMANYTKAKFLQDPNKKTPVFVRFSTVAGGRGSADTVRDVRGFATKFYTEEGNYDLVGQRHTSVLHQRCHEVPGSGPCRKSRATQQYTLIFYGAQQLLGFHIPDSRVDTHAHLGLFG